MKIISWNINSLLAHEMAFRNVIDQEQPDIFCLQEIRAREDQIAFRVEGYRSYLNPATLSRYYGTGVYIKNCVHPLSITFDPPVPGHDYEGRIEAIEFENFFLVNSYWPFSSTIEFLQWRLEWNERFNSFIQSLRQRKPVVICGDTNMVRGPLDTFDGKYIRKKPCFYPEEHEAFERFLEVQHLIDSYRYLHPDGTAQLEWPYDKKNIYRKNRQGFRIDLFLVNEDLISNVSSSDVLEQYEGSDHCPISLSIE
jgi:exodeoxyribonuclease-3